MIAKAYGRPFWTSGGRAMGSLGDDGGDSSGIDWTSILTAGIDAGTKIGTSILNPQTNTGQYLIRNGQLYQVTPGQSMLSFSGSSAGSGSMLLYLAIAAVAIVLLKK